MKDWELLEMIPPETIGLIAAAMVGLLISAIAYVRWLLRYHAKVQDEKLNAIRQEREIEKAEADARLAEAEAARMRKDREIQRQLDETQNGRETMRLLFSELAETRKDDKEIRASYERREAAFVEAMANISKATQSIEVNSASTLALLKEHKDADDIMVIRQEKLMKQNDTTHERLSEMMNVLSTLSAKLETVAVGRSSDKKVLDEIKDAIEKVQASMKRLEDTTQPIPSLIESIKAPVVTTTELHKDDTIKLPEIDEKKEETT